MKRFFNFFFTLLGLVVFLVVCAFSTNDSLTVVRSAAAIPWHYIIAGLLALYEIIVRLIPSVANISIIHWIVEFLKWLDTLLTRNISKS
jgi:vacuolar-type H+-ATPase subunit I/STV1